MAWAYNQIDVKVAKTDNQLGETNPNNGNWWTISDYGILRGRPTVTPSTVDTGNTSTIPGRNGSPYPVNKRRGNATLEFEVLVVDAWPFIDKEGTYISSGQPEPVYSLSIAERVDRLRAIGQKGKRVSYKEPGRDYTTFFIVYNTMVTEQDADEHASVLKFKMEVFPFKFDFIGNRGVTIQPGDTGEDFDDYTLFSGCYPIYKFKLPTLDDEWNKIIVQVTDPIGDRRYSTEVKIAAYEGSQNHTTYIDTDKMLVYGISTDSGFITKVRSRSQYLDGDISGLTFPMLSGVHITHYLDDPITVYPRSGIEI